MLGVVVVEDQGDGRTPICDGLHETIRNARRDGVRRCDRGQEVVRWQLPIGRAECLDHQPPEAAGVSVTGHVQPEVWPVSMSQPLCHQRRLPIPGGGADQNQATGHRLVQPRPKARPGDHREQRVAGNGCGKMRCRRPVLPQAAARLSGSSHRGPESSGCPPLLYPRTECRQRTTVKGMLAFPRRGMAYHPLLPTLMVHGCRPASIDDPLLTYW
jgi:hypothetical protein